MKETQPFKAVLDGDHAALAAAGEKGLLEIVAATHTGMTTEEFTRTVLEWIATARHPRFHRPYTELVYQPMLELMGYLRGNGLAAGSGVRFMGLVHHTDAEREYAYDRQSHIGRLDKALDEANVKGWTVVDMKRDWRTIFPSKNRGRLP